MSSAIDKMVAYIDKANINLEDDNPHSKPLIFFNDSTVRTAALQRQVATLEIEVELLREKLNEHNYEE
ncbi:hypothetical protein [Kamptonema sp. PCC 6506]|uniref:hypothetical protein n=1 Tax=Kamptonema sp. PCC 6506 TaxID=272129 RepID=UPI0001DAC7E7|nr:hypothetical protein [Kamptonema sp. PCC 6506]CBN54933.1 hypothetical protein OSCI_1210003 [Kamptonema sp. PCC 6506]